MLTFFRSALDVSRSLFLPLGHVGKMVGVEILRAVLNVLVVVAAWLVFGIAGVFVALAALYAGLFGFASVLLLRIIRLRPRHVSADSLRPHMVYAGSTYIGVVAGQVQARFAVYGVATWVTVTEAGYLGVATQMLFMLQTVFGSVRRALLPFVAEFEDRGELSRVRSWGGLAMRYATALACVTLISWVLVGREVVDWLLTDRFAPVYECAAMMLTAGLFLAGALVIMGILYIRGFAWLGSANKVLYAAATIVGLVFVVGGEPEGTAYRISVVYALATALHFVAAYFSLGLRGGTWLPLRRTVMLMGPALAAWPASQWDAGFPTRLAAVFVFAAAYLGAAMMLRLLPRAEMMHVVRSLAGSRSGSE